MASLPSPREKLADCVWLPRIIAKARLLQADTLPPEYANRFCQSSGVDHEFLTFFDLTKEEILSAARRDDSEIAAWFLGRTEASRIPAWDHTAENLGRPGFPMARRFPRAMATIYGHLDTTRIDCVFDALDADEGRGQAG